jgi:hypothetical protein
MAEPFRQRCYLVYAIAPAALSAAEANDALNAYIENRDRGVVVSHDHFVGSPHGGFAVFDVRSEAELALLDDPGPLTGWELRVHALTFSLSAVGFAAQIDFTLREYANTSLAELRDTEPSDPRFWWQRRQ